ncbi:MAG: hypothetical protein WB868_21530 [Xanthobacteraceae bacterium]
MPSILTSVAEWAAEQLASWGVSSILKRAGSFIMDLGAPTKTALIGAGVASTLIAGAIEHHRGYEEAMKANGAADAKVQIQIAQRDADIQRHAAATVAVDRDKLKKQADALQNKVQRYEAQLSTGACPLSRSDVRRLRAIR